MIILLVVEHMLDPEPSSCDRSTCLTTEAQGVEQIYCEIATVYQLNVNFFHFFCSTVAGVRSLVDSFHSTRLQNGKNINNFSWVRAHFFIESSTFFHMLYHWKNNHVNQSPTIQYQREMWIRGVVDGEILICLTQDQHVMQIKSTDNI